MCSQPCPFVTPEPASALKQDTDINATFNSLLCWARAARRLWCYGSTWTSQLHRPRCKTQHSLPRTKLSATGNLTRPLYTFKHAIVPWPALHSAKSSLEPAVACLRTWQRIARQQHRPSVHSVRCVRLNDRQHSGSEAGPVRGCPALPRLVHGAKLSTRVAANIPHSS
jgi:hypothetical protein